MSYDITYLSLKRPNGLPFDLATHLAELCFHIFSVFEVVSVLFAEIVAE